MNAPSTPDLNVTAPHIDDDGDVIRITVGGATWVLKDETAAILRKHRALYPDNSDVSSAFWHGVLTCLSMKLTTIKEKPSGKTRQDEER